MCSQRIFKSALFLLVFLLAGGARAAELTHLNLLKNITTQQEEGAVVFRLEFMKPVDAYKGPVFYKKSVQMDFSNSFIKPAKRYFSTGDSRVSRIHAVQFDPHTVRVRFMLDGDGRGLGGNFHLRRQGRFLVARIEKSEPDLLQKLLKKIRAEDKNRVAEAVPAQPVEKAGAATAFPENEESLPPRVTRPPSQNQDKSPPAVKTLDKTGGKKTFKLADLSYSPDAAPADLLSSGITMFSMLAVVLALMFFVFYLFKKFVLKNGLLGGNGKLVKVLGTGMIAPRKTIALVEVAGEVLILGISNDQITFLSAIRDEDKIEQIREGAGSIGKLWPAAGAREKAAERDPGEVNRSAGDFKKYLKHFTDDKPSREQSIAGVTAMIRKNLGKIRTV